MRYWIAAAALVSGLVLSGSVRAEMSAKDWLALYDSAPPVDKVSFELIIRATENGIGWAEAGMKTGKTVCTPPDLVLQDKQLIDILRRSSKSNPKIATAPVGYAVLLSLRSVFPCPPQ